MCETQRIPRKTGWPGPSGFWGGPWLPHVCMLFDRWTRDEISEATWLRLSPVPSRSSPLPVFPSKLWSRLGAM